MTIERTTWCRKLETQHRRGYRYTYLLPNVPFDLTEPGKLIILAEPSKFRTRSEGSSDFKHVDRPVVLELRSKKHGTGVYVDAQVFRHNQRIAPELLEDLIY
jgi:hypothetical protein